MFELRKPTPPQWVETPIKRFDEFLLDHAACERKASAVGIAFVVQYPDKHHLIEPMIRFAQEELSHFHIVYKEILKRKLVFKKDEKDPYVIGLLSKVRTSLEGRLLDRLIVNSVIEARGTERFFLLSKALEDEHFKALYLKLAQSEAGHKALFIKLAKHYFSDTEIKERLDYFLDVEQEVVDNCPFRAAVH